MIALSRSYGGKVLTDGGANLLGYWPLDNKYGANDRAATPHNGTGTGGVSAGTARGPAGFATAFDGTDDTFTTTLACFAALSVRTFELWTWRDSAATGYRTMIGSTGAAANAFGFYTTGTGGNVELYPSNSIGAPHQWAAALPNDDAWNHVMVVYDDNAGDASLYVNGSLVGSDNKAGTYNASAGNLQIGGYAGATPHAGDTQQGREAHVAVYSGDQSALAPSHYLLGKKHLGLNMGRMIG